MSRFERIRRRKRRRLIRLALFLFVIFGSIYFFSQSSLFFKPKGDVLSTKEVRTEITQAPIPTISTSADISKLVQEELEGTKGSYSVYFKDLDSQAVYTLNSDQSYEAGSLYKLWVMAETFNQLKEGKLKEESILSQDVTVLNDKFKISSESAELTEGKVTYSVKDALTRMITISDNYAALLLAEKIRLSNATLFLKEHGLNNSKLGGASGVPTITSTDAGLFFEKLYKGELADREYTEKMLTLLKSQRLNHKIPKHLPPGTVIAHKTGELGQFSHDGGIIYSPKGNYILIVLTKSTNPSQAVERISNVSLAIYNYFTTSK